MGSAVQFGRIIKKTKDTAAGIAERGIIRANQLGIIPGGQVGGLVPKVRSADIAKLNAYYEGTQYDELQPWEASNQEGAPYTPIRKRKPRVIYNLPKRICVTFASKLVGENVFPTFKIEGTGQQEVEDQEFLKLLVEESGLRTVMPAAMRRMGAAGAVLLRFRINNFGAIRMEVFDSNYCYPTFDDNGELESVRIRYTYDDPLEQDKDGKAVEKWFQLDLGKGSDILYDNPVYKKDSAPQFIVKNQVDHQLGFVQAEWFASCEDRHHMDGESLLGGGACSMFDEINYSLSQSSQAVSYAQEPQLTFSGMDVGAVSQLERTSTRAWNLGREGKAGFLEAGLEAVERAQDMRDRVRLAVQDVTRIVLQDPEKLVGSAQSGRALEILNEPLVDLITEIRPLVGKRMSSVLLKLAVACMRNVREGLPAPVQLPSNYVPMNFPTMKLVWPKIFEETTEDIQKRVAIAVSAANANVVSRVKAIEFIARHFNITDVEAEIALIEGQKQFNTFGF